MLFNTKRFAVSTCPECGETSKKEFSAFDFSGKKDFGAICKEQGCNSLIWKLKEAKDKYKITVNCPACDEPHTYNMSKSNFWNKPYFSFNCPTWGDVNILYFGKDEKFIDRQIEAQNEDIIDMIDNFTEYDEFVNLMYETIECINEIAKANNVKCGCNNPNITINIEEDRIFLECKNCGAKKAIEVSEENLDTITELGTIVLDDK